MSGIAESRGDLQLLLTDAEDRLAIAEQGLPKASVLRAPAPTPTPGRADTGDLEQLDADPNDLRRQRWGVIAPASSAGDRYLEAIAPLIELRSAEQGAPAKIFRAPQELDAEAAIAWKNQVLRAESLPEFERPRYLLLLGDLPEVSLPMQQILAHGAFVGRLAGDTTEDYASYANKVVARARGAITAAPPNAHLFTVHDGTPATAAGYRYLVRPCLEFARSWREEGKLWIADAIEVPHDDLGPEPLLEAIAGDHPTVLLTLSHGLGAPRRGWRSYDHQRRLQGALALGLDADPITAEVVRARPFAPGGMWFCVACFAAGTPENSEYYAWLRALAESGTQPQPLGDVLRSLARGGPAFVGALPKAALANPDGPLAMIGHVDLAWTYSFTDHRGRTSQASRIFSSLRTLLAGSRCGVALDALMRAYRETNDELMTGYQRRRDAEIRGNPDPLVPVDVARRWMQRNDLRGYVLLGDPAARLAIDVERASGGPAETRTSAPPPVSSAPASSTTVHTPTEATLDVSPTPSTGPGELASAPAKVDAPRITETSATSRVDPPERPRADPSVARTRESAVWALLRGAEPPLAIADRVGTDIDELFDWLERYRVGGRHNLD